MPSFIQSHHAIPTIVHRVNQSTTIATTNHQPPVHQIQMTDNKLKIRTFPIFSLISFPPFWDVISIKFRLVLHRRSRKRRSNRRKATQQNMQNVCNAGLAPLGEVAATYEMNTNSSYVMNTNATDASSPMKKRKLSSQDVPGPSSYNTKSSPNEAPMSEFYHSLLESSYQDDLNCKSKKKIFVAISETNALLVDRWECL